MSVTAIDAGRLLGELGEQWRLVGKNDGGVLRACSMTLGVVAGRNRDLQEIGATVAELMHEHPNRTILLRVGDGSAPVEAHTSIQCWMPFGRQQQICCEQIEIDAGLGSLSDVPPILFGLTVPDLPIAMWCPDLDLALRREIAPVLRLAGKVIIDTSCRSDAGAAWQSIQTLRNDRWRLADLVWARVTRWRELVFQTITVRGYRQPPQRARITWAGAPLPPSAMYLAAWLCARMGWQGDLGNHLEMECEEEAMPETGTGRLRSLTISGGECSLRLHRPEGTGMAIEIEGVSAGARFPVFTDSALLHEELGVFGTDRQFEQALEACPEVLELAR